MPTFDAKTGISRLESIQCKWLNVHYILKFI